MALHNDGTCHLNNFFTAQANLIEVTGFQLIRVIYGQKVTAMLGKRSITKS